MAVTPGQVNLLCPQGSTFSKQITYTITNPDFNPSQPESEENPKNIPVDLTGYSAKMQVRQNYYSEDALLDLSSPDNGITIEGSEGIINIYISDGDTSSLPAGNFLYDLELDSNGGTVSRLIEGSFIVTPEVTR
jgi:hypothetical protein